MFNKNVFSKKNKKEIIDFVMSHELSDGGFSVSLFAPPSLEDTYYALKSLRELGNNHISETTVRYLKELLKQGKLSSLKLAYHLGVLIKDYRIRVKLDAIEKTLKNLHPNTVSELYYFFMLNKILFHKAKLDKEKSIWSKDRTPEKLKYAEEVGRYVLLMKELGLSYDKERYIHWLQLLQNSDGGFGMKPGTTSFLEHTYMALRALIALNAKPLLVKKCREFIITSQANDGGFGRQSITVPRLEYTYFAIISFKIID
jgi:hypothetical protein